MKIIKLKGYLDKGEIYSEISDCFCQSCKRKNDPFCGNCSIRTVLDIIMRAPVNTPKTIAKWEICSDGYYPYCSNCKEEPQGRVMTDYCPNCGAYMKGDKNDK